MPDAVTAVPPPTMAKSAERRNRGRRRRSRDANLDAPEGSTSLK
jgi:hypothetical protein